MSDERVRGFDRKSAVPLRGDSIEHRVGWRERSLAALPPGSYRLRLYLERAELFAVSLYGEAAVGSAGRAR